MIVSSAETAELRLSAPPPIFTLPPPIEMAPPVADPAFDVVATGFTLAAVVAPVADSGATKVPCRSDLVAARRKVRNEQRRLAYLCIGVLVAAFGGTVAILDTIH